MNSEKYRNENHPSFEAWLRWRDQSGVLNRWSQPKRQLQEEKSLDHEKFEEEVEAEPRTTLCDLLAGAFA